MWSYSGEKNNTYLIIWSMTPIYDVVINQCKNSILSVTRESIKANETFDDIAYEVSKNIALQSKRIQVYYN